MPSTVAIAAGPSPVTGLFVFPMNWILLTVGLNRNYFLNGFCPIFFREKLTLSERAKTAE